LTASIPITAYGAIFAALGCSLDFNSSQAELIVVKSPGALKKAVDAALTDIAHYEDTSNFSDGMAAIHLAETIDGEPNPLTDLIKADVLNALGIIKDGRFVAQVLAQQKTNRSWHVSEKPNECTFFGEICTHRGIVNTPGKRGRKSTRRPEQYHMRSARTGEIAREQLVTPAVESLVDKISPDRLISVNAGNVGISLDKMDNDQIQELLAKIKQVQEERKVPSTTVGI